MTNRFMVRIGSLVLVGNYSGNGITIKILFVLTLKHTINLLMKLSHTNAEKKMM